MKRLTNDSIFTVGSIFLGAIALTISSCNSDFSRLPRLMYTGATETSHEGGVIGAETKGSEPPPVTSAIQASSWMGINLDGDLMYVDVTRMLKPFNTTNLDQAGYPNTGVSATSSTDVGFLLPTGDYKISYKGTGSVSVSGVGVLAGQWQTVGDEKRNVIRFTSVPRAFGNMFNLVITNLAEQKVTDLHIYFTGIDYGSTEVFLPKYLRLLAPFRTLRFMSMQNAWQTDLANWADRPALGKFGALKGGAHPYENIYQIANLTGKDIWINIPAFATDDFVRQFADFVRDNLDYGRIDRLRAAQGLTTPFQIVLELSNETWGKLNNATDAFTYFLNKAKLNPSRYPRTITSDFAPSWMVTNGDLVQEAGFSADRLIQVSLIFKNEFGAINKSSIIKPVLGGWAAGAAYSDFQLQFIQRNYGPPANFVNYVALAPYFGTTNTSSVTLILEGLLPKVRAFDPIFRDFAALRSRYNVEIAGYEGGQALTTGTSLNHWNFHNNSAVMALEDRLEHAQFDKRMYDAYVEYLNLWKQYFGKSIFNHLGLAGFAVADPFALQWGFWGSLPSVLTDIDTCGNNLPVLMGPEPLSSIVNYCPKYKALLDVGLAP